MVRFPGPDGAHRSSWPRLHNRGQGNRLIDGKDQDGDHLAHHRDDFEKVETGTEHRYAYEVVSKIKGGIVARFVFLKERREDKRALVLMTNALEMSVQEVLLSYKRRWDIEVYYRDREQCLGMDEYQVRGIDVGVIHLLLVDLAYTLLKCIAAGRLFYHVFKGAESIGAMCEALKRFATSGPTRSFRDRG